MFGIGRIAQVGAPGRAKPDAAPRRDRPVRDGAASSDQLILSDAAKKAASPTDPDPKLEPKAEPKTEPKAGLAEPMAAPKAEPNPEARPEPKAETPAAPPRRAGIPGLGLVAGAGDLTPGLRWDIGAASALQMGPNLGYVGLDYDRTFTRPVSEHTLLAANVHPTVLRTFTGGPTSGVTTAQVLTTGGIIHMRGPLTLMAGAGAITDLTAIGRSGSPVFTPVMAAGVTYDAGPVVLDAEAIAPFQNASDAWQVRTKVSFPRNRYLPDLAVVTAAYGVDRIEASKSFRLSKNLDATISVTENIASPNGKHLSAGAGLRWNF